MTILDQIKERMAELSSQYDHDSEVLYQSVATYIKAPHGSMYLSDVPIITCKDCKHSHEDGTICNLFAGYAPIAGGDEYEEVPAAVEPDGFCAWACSRTE